ncbi:hypothetical protein D3C78_640660 [compost metagenome]
MVQVPVSSSKVRLKPVVIPVNAALHATPVDEPKVGGLTEAVFLTLAPTAASTLAVTKIS